MALFRPSTWHPSMAWMADFKISDVWGGIKEDVVKGAKTVQSSAKAILKGVTGTLTPTIVWLVVILIIGLLLYTWLRKAIKI